MNQREQIDVFIEGVRTYFEHISLEGEVLEIGSPYLIPQSEPVGRDYTGIISVTGSSVGYVFFSANRALLTNILLRHGEATFSLDLLMDIVGEVANTIAGNARRRMGEQFHISVPRVITGTIRAELLNQAKHALLLPIRWKNNRAQLIVSLAATTK